MAKQKLPWERLANEGEGAFEAFVAYRDLAADRSIKAVGQKCVKSGSLLGRWSVRFHWVERARAWDQHIQAERDRVAKSEARKWERRRLDRLETSWQDAQGIRAKAREILAAPIVEVIEEKDSDGNTTTTTRPIRFRVKDAAAMIEIAGAIEADTLAAAPGGDRQDANGAPLRPSNGLAARAALKAFVEASEDRGRQLPERKPESA